MRGMSSQRATGSVWTLRLIPSAVLAVAMTVAAMPVYARSGPPKATSSLTIQTVMDRMDADYWALKTLLLAQQVDTAITAGTIAAFDKWGPLTEAAMHATNHQELWTYDPQTGRMLVLIAYKNVNAAQKAQTSLKAIVGSYGGTVTIQPYDPGAFTGPADGGFWEELGEWLVDAGEAVVDAVVTFWNDLSLGTKVVVVVEVLVGSLAGAAVTVATNVATDLIDSAAPDV